MWAVLISVQRQLFFLRFPQQQREIILGRGSAGRVGHRAKRGRDQRKTFLHHKVKIKERIRFYWLTVADWTEKNKFNILLLVSTLKQHRRRHILSFSFVQFQLFMYLNEYWSL